MSTNRVVSFDDEPLILVDREDRILGYDSKVNVHLGTGALHRAFSIFLVSDTGSVLLQQRSREKPLWPLYWTNSCCSHPRKGEERIDAAHRRLREELALDTDLSFIYQFEYHAPFGAVGSEREMCSVYVGRFPEEVAVDVNPTEVAAWRWLPFQDVDRLIADQSSQLTPWFIMEWTSLRQDFADCLLPRRSKT
ncbi:isopentenyl-diphosphate delta-isomerase, partial [Thioalkalicoccus limnaeus]